MTFLTLVDDYELSLMPERLTKQRSCVRTYFVAVIAVVVVVVAVGMFRHFFLLMDTCKVYKYFKPIFHENLSTVSTAEPR